MPTGTDLPGSLEEARALTLHDNAELRAAHHREVAARRAIAKVEADLLPQASLNASYGRTYSSPPLLTDNGDAQLTVQVVLPISIGGEGLARSRQARITLRQRRQESIAKRAEVTAGIGSAWAALTAARQGKEFGHAASTSSEQALRGVRAQRLAGDKTLLDVLNAEQELVETKLQELRSRSDLVVSTYAILATIGKLSAVAAGSPASP